MILNIVLEKDGKVRLCDFGSCLQGYMPLRSPDDRARAEEDIGKNTTQMYRAPEMVDLYLREELTEKTDVWVWKRNEKTLYLYFLCLFFFYSFSSL